MIEAMEQQIINSINNRWTKDKEKRREVDMQRISEYLRVICSSRNSSLSIINDLKSNQNFAININKLRENLNWIYKWITTESIDAIYAKYNATLLDKKKESEYLKEIPTIQLFLQEFKITIITETIDKLIKFHDINRRDNEMLEPKRPWREFYSLNEKIEKLKDWKIISPKATDIKELYYKGTYTGSAVICDVVGFVDDNEIVLSLNNKLHSILPDYFLEMQKRERFIIVDIETPGSFSPASGIREVAAILVEDFRVVDSIHLAIISDENLYKLGYGQGLESIENNEELKQKFKSFIKKYKCPLIAHNASFDRNFLRHWGWVAEDDEFCCSMNNIKLNVKLENYKMATLLQHYGIKNEQTHTAMQDVLDLLEILKIVKIEKWRVMGQQYDTQSDPKDPDAPKKKFSYTISKETREKNKKKLELAKENIIENIFDGKKIVFTGDLSKDRNDMMVLAINYGAKPTTSVSKNTHLIVAGSNPGKSKITKAEELNTKIITEEEFFELIKLSN